MNTTTTALHLDLSRAPQRHARANDRSEGQGVPKKKARTTARVIEAALLHPKAVAITMPSISPIAQPVRQCSVARTADRFRDSA